MLGMQTKLSTTVNYNLFTSMYQPHESRQIAIDYISSMTPHTACNKTAITDTTHKETSKLSCLVIKVHVKQFQHNYSGVS